MVKTLSDQAFFIQKEWILLWNRVTIFSSMIVCHTKKRFLRHIFLGKESKTLKLTFFSYMTQKTFPTFFPCLRINILLKFFVYLLSSAFFGTTFYLSKALKRSDFSASDVWALNRSSGSVLNGMKYFLMYLFFFWNNI